MKYSKKDGVAEKKESPLLMSIVLFMIAVGLGVVVFMDIHKDYDLLRNGKITVAKVVSVTPREENRKHGKHYRLVTVFDTRLAFDNMQLTHELENRIAPGGQVEVYYSTVHPTNLKLRDYSHPFRSVTDILFTLMTGMLLFFWLLSLGAALFFLARHLRGREDGTPV